MSVVFSTLMKHFNSSGIHHFFPISLNETVSIDLHQLAQRRTGPLTRVLIGDAQPNRWLVGPCRAVLYIEGVGTAALVTRFAAATVPTVLNPNPI